MLVVVPKAEAVHHPAAAKVVVVMLVVEVKAEAALHAAPVLKVLALKIKVQEVLLSEAAALGLAQKARAPRAINPIEIFNYNLIA